LNYSKIFKFISISCNFRFKTSVYFACPNRFSQQGTCMPSLSLRHLFSSDLRRSRSSRYTLTDCREKYHKFFPKKFVQYCHS